MHSVKGKKKASLLFFSYSYQVIKVVFPEGRVPGERLSAASLLYSLLSAGSLDLSTLPP